MEIYSKIALNYATLFDTVQANYDKKSNASWKRGECSISTRFQTSHELVKQKFP